MKPEAEYLVVQTLRGATQRLFRSNALREQNEKLKEQLEALSAKLRASELQSQQIAVAGNEKANEAL